MSLNFDKYPFEMDYKIVLTDIVAWNLICLMCLVWMHVGIYKHIVEWKFVIQSQFILEHISKL